MDSGTDRTVVTLPARGKHFRGAVSNPVGLELGGGAGEMAAVAEGKGSGTRKSGLRS